MDKHNKGIKLKRLRAKTEYSLEEVAAMCEITSNELAEIEKGKRYPSDASLRILLDLYHITMNDLERNDFIDHEKRAKIINYVQIGIVILLLLAYFLPFTLHYYGPEQIIVPDDPGFMLLFNDLNGNPYVVSIVFIVFLVELVMHFLLYTKMRKYSNIFKVVFIMMNLSSLILLYINFVSNNYLMSTLWVLIGLLSFHMIVSVYDLVKYPLNHDTQQDLSKMRRLFTFLIMTVYLLMYLYLVFNLIRTSYSPEMLGYVFYIVWGTYLISYIVLRKRLFESRRNVSLYLLFPPITFLIFNVIAYTNGEDSLTDPGSIMIILMLFLPVFIVNVDYFISMIKGIIFNEDTHNVGL